MTSLAQKIHVSLLILAVLVSAGCGGPTRPPQDLLDSATRSLSDARAAGAQTYAPLELRFATERLDQAQAAISREDYAAAGRLARESEANGELATAKAKLGTERAASEALDQQNADLRRELGSDAGQETNR
ncbi:MAG: DUF4398 domain-containing protein [Dokdonella sp.]